MHGVLFVDQRVCRAAGAAAPSDELLLALSWPPGRVVVTGVLLLVTDRPVAW